MDSGDPLTVEHTCECIATSINNYAHPNRSYGYSAVVKKGTGAFVGFSWLIYRPDTPDVEIVYTFASSVWSTRFAN